MLIVNGHKPLGRLGNQLELATHLIAFSLLSGQRVNLPFDKCHAKHFPHCEKNILNCFPRLDCSSSMIDAIAEIGVKLATRGGVPRPLDLMTGGVWVHFDAIDASAHHFPSVQRMASARFCAADLWRFRTSRLSASAASVVRSVLSPTDDVLGFSRGIRQSVGRELVIGVHIRLGDFRAAYPERIFSLDYYRARMRELVELFAPRQVGFVVCSDQDVSGDFSGLPCVFPRSHPVADLFALAHCDYIAGVPSTFSRWAAFWGRKKLCRFLSHEQRITTEEDFRWVDVPGNGLG